MLLLFELTDALAESRGRFGQLVTLSSSLVALLEVGGEFRSQHFLAKIELSQLAAGGENGVVARFAALLAQPELVGDLLQGSPALPLVVFKLGQPSLEPFQALLALGLFDFG